MCNLLITLYGLKQSPKTWFEKINSYLINIGLENPNVNQNVYIKREGNLLVFHGLYIDDCVMMSNGIALLEKKKSNFTLELHMIDVVPIQYCFGI
jgi:hypothetical protein